MVTIENESNFFAALHHGVNLFLGAGFSVLAKDGNGRPLPVGDELPKELKQQFSQARELNLPLPELCTFIAALNADDLNRYLRRRLTVGHYDDRYDALLGYSIRTIFSTNIDDLPYHIYANSKTHYLNDVDTHGPAYHDRTAVNYVALHGSVRNRDRPLRFTSVQIAIAPSVDPDRWFALRNQLSDYPIIFWGYGMRDTGALFALAQEGLPATSHRDKWIVVRPTAEETGAIASYRALGFQIIRAETPELLEYLAAQSPESEQEAVPSAIEQLAAVWPGATLPHPQQVGERPISEFFLGAPPEWGDVYSGRIHATNHFDTIRNYVNEGKNVLVSGIPATGKTTLLMQVAASFRDTRRVLFFDSLSVEKAEMIRRAARGNDRILVFLDNCADSSRAMSLLANSRGIQIVGADRAYLVDIAIHLITENGSFYPIDVTTINPFDIQRCLAKIPANILQGTSSIDPSLEGDSPSIFEIIENRLVGPDLKDRFFSVLEQLRQSNQRIEELIVMMGYVQSCRVPISMDMLVAFFRGQTKDYRDIYDWLDRLGALVVELDLPSLGEQDCYRARSTIAGEAIVSVARQSLLAQVITRFHNNVSPYRIPGYSEFQKNAFKHDLFNRVFPNWREGLALYNFAYDRDRNPYLLQHAALYLNERNRNREAFDYIEQAEAASSGRNWTIKNTHAVLLFRVNIDLPDRPEVEKGLALSMEMLRECHQWDNRKWFHAVTFGDHALRLAKRYGDDFARGFLEEAYGWLSEEAAPPFHPKGVDRVRANVGRELRRLGIDVPF